MGALKNAFKKATLTAALATSLAVGTTGSAFAQTGNAHAGPPPGPDQQTTQTYNAPSTQPTVPVKPWENDPNYVRLVKAYDHQLSARERIYQAQLQGNQKISDANFQIAEANIEQGRMNMRGFNPQAMANYASQQANVNAAHQTQSVQIKANYDNAEAREDMARSQYLNNLDNRFANLPQYRNGSGVEPNQGPPPWSTDPAYLKQLSIFDNNQDNQSRINGINEAAQLRSVDANHQAQQINMNAQGINAARQGIPGVTRLEAQEEIMTAQYKMQRTSIEANFDQQRGQMEAQRAEFLFNLDQRFGSMPQYKNSVTPQQQAPRVTTHRPGA